MRPRDGELSLVGKAVVVVVLAGAAVAAVRAAIRGYAPHPPAFGVTMLGLLCFSIAKASVVRTGRLVSFGSAPMTSGFANLYRLGYWLMAVGLLLTFAP